MAASTLILLSSAVPAGYAAQPSSQEPVPKSAVEHLPRPERPREVKDREFDPHSVFVRFKRGASAAAKDRALKSRGASRVGAVRGTRYVEARTSGAAPDLLRQLRDDPAVAEVSLDYQRRTAALPNDPYFAGGQSYLDTVRLQQAWDLSKGSTSQIVAVADTGVDGLHADLQGVTVEGYNAITGAAIAAGTNSDDNGHGSMVAGIAAANTGNRIGIAGAAWTARVMPIKVLGASGSGYDSDIAAGITWAADHGATIVNLSLGGPADSPLLHDAVTYATGKGALVVVAAGNYGSGLPLYPAAYPEVLAVGATDSAGSLTDFSSWGDHIDVAAPGFDIMSTGRNQTYVVGDGTSFAAPIAAGVASLVRTANPSWTPEQVIARLRSTARDAGPRGIDPYYGFGVLDAYHALGGTPGGEFPARALGASEPNDVPARATVFATSVTGTLAAEGDVDWYRFDSTGEGSVDVTVTPPTRDGSIAQNADPILTVYDKDLRLIGKVDKAGPGGAETLKFVGDIGTYHVSVRNYNGAADSRSYTLAVATGSTAPLFQPATWTSVGDAEARTVDVADVTGDGRDDVLLMTSGYTGSENDHKLLVFAQRPDGTLAPPVRYGTDAVPHPFFAVLDTNGDGRQDVAINTVSGINVLRQTASGTLESAGLLPAKGSPVAADMDGDGDGDLVATASNVGITLLTQGDGGNFTSTPVTTDDVGEVEVGDVDGDGKVDVVGAPPPYLGNAPIYVYHPTETGWTRTNHPTGMTSPQTVNGIEVADVSGDGRADIITTFGGNKPSAQVSVLVQNATGGLDNGALYPVWDIPQPVEAADVTGDSRLDVVVLHGGWHTVSVLPQTSDGRLGTPVRTDDLPYATSYTMQGLALGDINGDNRIDAVVADYNNGLVMLRNNNGPTRGGPQMWVRDVSPADFASEVLPAVVPSVTFQRAVDAESVSSSTVRLVDGRTGAVVTASVSYDAGTRTARVTPAVALQDETPYRLVVEGVRDTSGEGQTERFSSTFSTVDTAPGPVIDFQATGALREAGLSWTVPSIADFDQVIVRMATGKTAPSSVTTGTAVYAGTGSSVTVSGLTDGSTYTFAAWVRDRSGKLSSPSTVTVTGSAVTISSSAKTVTYGSSVSVTGRLTRTDTRAAIAGASVQLYGRPEGSTTWSLVGTATSNSTGDVSLSHTPSVSTAYQWIYHGTTGYTGADSPLRTVQVRTR
ncbi:S8 family serine peptidase [Micromonospora tulbaghiae]|uniref:S8 family serine peptidase n=1 Tax=Micromonospora tulbaghiae TaxID=479978 RepID=UPI003EBC03AB